MSGGEPSSIKWFAPGATASRRSVVERVQRVGLFCFVREVEALYTALYRKYRPQTFADVIGQNANVTALKNQVASGRIGHAYIFTGTRGTGQTTCAKIFARAINCRAPRDGEPCGECEVCQGIASGGVFDIVEIDAASNNGVDDVRELREETAYIPAVCTYKVYIIDEVHMLSQSAFNALLKIMEEPPPHVVFILATTEVHKVPATILSRCQRYDFSRVPARLIAQRVLWVAEQEGLEVTEDAAMLLARLADGAVRDALSLLDTCLTGKKTVDEETVRAVAGISDRAFLFRLSDAVKAQDLEQTIVLAEELMSRSVEVKRLTEELIYHYRNILLAGLSSAGEEMLGAGAEYFDRYQQEAASTQKELVIRAIKTLGSALDKMGKGTDPRIELELALFSLSQAPERPADHDVQARAMTAPVQQAPAEPDPHMPSAPKKETAPAPARGTDAGQAVPFDEWPRVIEEMKELDKLLYANMLGTRAYRQERRILIDGSEMFMEYMRQNADSTKRMKEVLEKVTGEKLAIGPYKPAKQAVKAEPQRSEGVAKLEQFGVPIEY